MVGVTCKYLLRNEGKAYTKDTIFLLVQFTLSYRYYRYACVVPQYLTSEEDTLCITAAQLTLNLCG